MLLIPVHILRIFVLTCCAAWTLCSAAEDPAATLARGEAAFNSGDLGEAITLYREAAQQGYAPAQSRLAYVLDKAEENDEAVVWYRKAAEQSDAQGEFGLGQMYSNGEGVGKDLAEALIWIRRAADRGLLPAIVAAARLLEEAQPRSLRDPAAAYEMWARAAQMGDQIAIRRMVAIHRGGELNHAVDEAQARTWEARLPPEPKSGKKKK